MRCSQASFVPLSVEMDVFRAARGRTQAKRLQEVQAGGRVKEEYFADAGDKGQRWSSDA